MIEHVEGYTGWAWSLNPLVRSRTKAHYFPNRAASLCWDRELAVLPNPYLTANKPADHDCCRRCLKRWSRRVAA